MAGPPIACDRRLQEYHRVTVQFPARVHVLLAQKAPVGLIIRRGPSKHVASVLWNRENDRFTLGQWLKGRIYERRSDLSPDGKHFIYFAMNGRWQGESKGSWTAVSRVPYLKAISFYPKGDCWNGGGLFTGSSSIWLNDGPSAHTCAFESSKVVRVQGGPDHFGGDECLGVYFPRLIRDGWQMVESRRISGFHEVTVFDKRCADGWVLRKLAHAQIFSPVGKGCYWDEHRLNNLKSGIELEFPDWEWADMDGERLVWGTEGRLETGMLSRSGPKDVRTLFDSNRMTFEAIAAAY